ncbi:MAG: CHAD domain-containing protein [Candidatus Solibacter sp.]
MREFVLAQTIDLLQQMAVRIKELKHAPGDDDAEAIHDVRVAIRRLRQCLLVFSKFYPGDSWKKLRRELSGVMKFCGAVRDRDIAIGLLTESGIAADSKLVRSLEKERRAADRDLRRSLERWKHRGMGKKFRSRLEA